MSEGTSLGFVWRQITVLLVWGIASFALSIKLFRWR
jgi:ABC-type transport system involved in multi-copper enzyme maturation permease subunit